MFRQRKEEVKRGRRSENVLKINNGKENWKKGKKNGERNQNREISNEKEGDKAKMVCK